MIIQYEYLQAYLDLYLDYPKFKIAREVCSKYVSYPVLNWRNKFIDLANQLAEFDGDNKLDKIDPNNQNIDDGEGTIENQNEEYFAVYLTKESSIEETNNEVLLKKREQSESNQETELTNKKNGSNVLKITHRN